MVLTLCVEGRSKGLQSRVFAYTEDGDFRRTLESSGVTVRYFPTNPGVRWGLARRLARELRQKRVDVLHTHHVGPFLYGGIAAKFAGIPVVHTEHSRELYDTPRPRLIGRTMPALARVVCVSNELASWRRENFGDSPLVIPNGVSIPTLDPHARTRARQELGLHEGHIAIGCVARFVPEKDHNTWVRAFAHAHQRVPNLRGVLIGWGPTTEPTRTLIEELQLSDAILMMGGRNDVEDLLPGFDAISLSSVREGLPLALLEGMARGLPVISTNVGEIGALVGESCGSVCAASAPEALGDLFAGLVDGEARKRHGEAARQSAIAHYSSNAMVSAYAALYREVTAK